MREDVERLVAEVIAPLVMADGGAVEVVELSEGATLTVTLRLGGACAGCPGLPYTRSRVIEPVLRRGLGKAVTVIIERGT